MPNLKLTELDPINTINFDSGDLLYIVDVAGNTSNKITYQTLVGDDLHTLAVNLTALSGFIDDNIANIAANGETITSLQVMTASNASNTTNLIDSVNSDRTNTQFISSIVDTLSTTQLTLCAAFFAFQENTDVGSLTVDVGINTAEIQTLTADVQENITDIESGGTKLTALQAVTATQNSAIAANTAKNTYPSGDATKVGFITITQAVNLDTLETTATAAIPLATLKTETAASTDFADFQSKIAAL